MSWDTTPAFDAAHRAALEHGKNLVYVCPPAGWAVAPVWRALPEAPVAPATTLVVVPEVSDALDLTTVLRRVPGVAPTHVIASPGRTDRLLRGGAVHTVLGTSADIVDAVRRSALRLEAVTRCVVAWPELAPAAAEASLDTVLGEAKGAQRILVTTDDGVIGDLIERHARRAPVAVHSRPPDERRGSLAYAVVPPAGRGRAARAVLDARNPDGAWLWDPHGDGPADLLDYPDVRPAGEGASPELVIATDLPSSDVVAAAAGCEMVALIRAAQLPYLRRLAHTVKPIRLVTEVDRARDRAFRLRKELREIASRAEWGTELLAIEPLLDEFDPALLAAAALSRYDVPETPAETPSWTRVYVSVGKRDRVRPADLVGTLADAAGLRSGSVGRIDIRETFTLIEVRPEDAQRAIRGLTGQTIRGRRVLARLDKK